MKSYLVNAVGGEIESVGKWMQKVLDRPSAKEKGFLQDEEGYDADDIGSEISEPAGQLPPDTENADDLVTTDEEVSDEFVSDEPVSDEETAKALSEESVSEEPVADNEDSDTRVWDAAVAEFAAPVLTCALRRFLVRRGNLLAAFRVLEKLEAEAEKLRVSSAGDENVREEVITQLLINTDSVQAQNNNLIRARRKAFVKQLHLLSSTSLY
uniref:BAG domain-containing protein n=1 Tax=Rhodosorus marinus TaxID=101924 RepID=A0A7S2ZAB9_9RHOD|mmetsp:Transcript_11899/g.49678  ORF Transcript_11899/g.49678 Transcript_11899/m.49678 type:complete len:211 (+) Transcript_11899:2515-3147(+)|eukprot:CAMPEP_0113970310 /NCGR_PEP_ID=MMETSP0011_2-20120614/11059_1 /TAXON_ID=101924 /ORGANISM="Rhodosorus marinus" /LENGTH=210 /DNA_ID=CAMNT_0000984579 /DNA_START=724 /DNA_END=1356 /DNA_ORIENTATION=- /assembly_acc=CAM_ASM_000156